MLAVFQLFPVPENIVTQNSGDDRRRHPDGAPSGPQRHPVCGFRSWDG